MSSPKGSLAQRNPPSIPRPWACLTSCPIIVSSKSPCYCFLPTIKERTAWYDKSLLLKLSFKRFGRHRSPDRESSRLTGMDDPTTIGRASAWLAHCTNAPTWVSRTRKMQSETEFLSIAQGDICRCLPAPFPALPKRCNEGHTYFIILQSTLNKAVVLERKRDKEGSRKHLGIRTFEISLGWVDTGFCRNGRNLQHI